MRGETGMRDLIRPQTRLLGSDHGARLPEISAEG